MKHTIRSKAGGRVVIERHEDVVQITVVSAATNAATVTMGPHAAAAMQVGIDQFTESGGRFERRINSIPRHPWYRKKYFIHAYLRSSRKLAPCSWSALSQRIPEHQI